MMVLMHLIPFQEMAVSMGMGPGGAAGIPAVGGFPGGLPGGGDMSSAMSDPNRVIVTTEPPLEEALK